MTTETQEFRIFQNATGRQRLQIRTRTVFVGDLGVHESNTGWKDVPIVYEEREERISQ